MHSRRPYPTDVSVAEWAFAAPYERLPETLAGLRFVVFTVFMLSNAATVFQGS